MHASDSLQQFDRHYESVAAAEGREFVVDLVAWVNWLEADARCRAVLSRIERDEARWLGKLRTVAGASAHALATLRKEMVERLPDAADRGTPKDGDRTLTGFDAHLAALERGEVTLPDDWSADATGLHEWGAWLLGRFNDAIQFERGADDSVSARAELEREVLRQGHLDFERALQTALIAHTQRAREFSLEYGASPLATWRRLRHRLLHELTREPLAQAFFVDEARYAEELAHSQLVNPWVTGDRLFHQLRQALSTQNQFEEVATRYQARCTKFELAELKKWGAAKSGGELQLATHCAKYLFDAGLDVDDVAIEVARVKNGETDTVRAAWLELAKSAAPHRLLLTLVLDGPPVEVKAESPGVVPVLVDCARSSLERVVLTATQLEAPLPLKAADRLNAPADQNRRPRRVAAAKRV